MGQSHQGCRHTRRLKCGEFKQEQCYAIGKRTGATINYETLGTRGEWIALTPGGRLGLEHVRSIAQRLADAGYRVLIHDRRNCGASEVVLEGNEPEHELWADDLYELLSQLNAMDLACDSGPPRQSTGSPQHFLSARCAT